MPSDTRAVYWLLDVTSSAQRHAIITTKRIGPSGTSFSMRECTCPAKRFRYLGDGAILADAQRPKQQPEEMVDLVSSNGSGSLSYHVCVAACAAVR